jgi:hypothetical protein
MANLPIATSSSEVFSVLQLCVCSKLQWRDGSEFSQGELQKTRQTKHQFTLAVE